VLKPWVQASHAGSPADDSTEGNTLVSVSTTFCPGAPHNTHPADLVLLSNDSVFFYVHTNKILKASENGFNHTIPLPTRQDHDQLGPVLAVPESSVVLNILLHAVYNMSCAHYAPSFFALESAVIALKTYGVPLHDRIANSTHLYILLMSHAPHYPLELYALAASNDLYDLAASTSSHLLSLTLASLTDEMARRIGPVYLKRLFFLHFGRADALKRLLISPPHPHAPTQWCDFTEQKKLTRAWALASAYLAWDARPGQSTDHPQIIYVSNTSLQDLSVSTMESALNPLGDHLVCDLCRDALTHRVKNLVHAWSVVKVRTLNPGLDNRLICRRQQYKCGFTVSVSLPSRLLSPPSPAHFNTRSPGSVIHSRKEPNIESSSSLTGPYPHLNFVHWCSLFVV